VRCREGEDELSDLTLEFEKIERRLCLISIGLLMAGAICIYLGRDPEGNAFDKFRVEHHCTVAGRTEWAIRKPEQTGFLCDDGITYWRNGKMD
jgi:hypothetical protein